MLLVAALFAMSLIIKNLPAPAVEAAGRVIVTAAVPVSTTYKDFQSLSTRV